MNPNLNVEAMNRAQGRMGTANWAGPQGQPMVQQGSQGQPQPMGTPNQRSDMPPPQAPAGGSASAARTQPSSPQPGQAPPTPSHSSKPNPKGKKDKNETRKRSTKKNSAANAPTISEADQPEIPTPSTPTIPVHPNSFNSMAGKGQLPGVSNGIGLMNNGPTSNPGIPAAQQIPPPDAMPGAGAFGDQYNTDSTFNMDFSGLESADVLTDFDFDSFLNNSDDTNAAWAMDPSLGGDNFGLDTTADG
jgi:hypothetical protein